MSLSFLNLCEPQEQISRNAVVWEATAAWQSLPRQAPVGARSPAHRGGGMLKQLINDRLRGILSDFIYFDESSYNFTGALSPRLAPSFSGSGGDNPQGCCSRSCSTRDVVPSGLARFAGRSVACWLSLARLAASAPTPHPCLCRWRHLVPGVAGECAGEGVGIRPARLADSRQVRCGGQARSRHSVRPLLHQAGATAREARVARSQANPAA